MKLTEYFTAAMQTTVNMALATSVNNQPNVRVVTFAWDEANKGRVYFTTFKGCQKEKEFAQNPHVACVLLPEAPEAQVQVRILGRVQKSEMGLEKIIEIIGNKYPGNADTIQSGGPEMEVYEIVFSEAFITVGIAEPQVLAI